MDSQPQQRFCVNCGQPLTPGVAFCVGCGTQVSMPQAGAPGQFSAGSQPGYQQSYMQPPMQNQEDPLIAGMASGYVASRMGRFAQQGARRPRSRLRGFGCLLIFLVVLVGPFIGLALGLALTKGLSHQIFIYVVAGMIVIFFLLVLIVMLATRSGREALSEGCLEAILGGIFGGG